MLAWGEAPGKFGTCLDGFSQVINLLCELAEFRLFGTGHIRPSQIDGQQQVFSEISADVFSLWHSVNTHLNELPNPLFFSSLDQKI